MSGQKMGARERERERADGTAVDMTGYSPSGKVSVYTDYSDSGLVTYVRKIVTQYTGLTYTTDKCGYGCSDHASAYSNGFREFTPPSFSIR